MPKLKRNCTRGEIIGTVWRDAPERKGGNLDNVLLRLRRKLAIDPANSEPVVRPTAVRCVGSPAAAVFFAAGQRQDRWQFDLPGYCAARLRAASVGHVIVTGIDTLAGEDRFFSHRRRTLAKASVNSNSSGSTQSFDADQARRLLEARHFPADPGPLVPVAEALR